MNYSRQSKAKTSKWPFSFNEDWNGWGWSVFFGQLIIAFGFLIFGLTHFALAARQPGATNYMIEQTFPSAQLGAAQLQTPQLRVQGSLSWQNGVAKIQDKQTGAVYRLSDSDEVRSLYEQGVRKVAVSGTLTGADTQNATIQVESMAAIQ